MSDIADQASKVELAETQRETAKVLQKAQQFEQGFAGHCDECGEYFERVVKRGDFQFCGGCRDKLGLD